MLLIRQIGVTDNYFSVGGDSMRSLAIVSKMRDADLPITVLDIENHPTICELAAVIESRAARASEHLSYTTVPEKGEYPLSFAQEYVVQTYARENLQHGKKPTGVFHIQDRLVVSDVRRHSMDALQQAVSLLIRRTPLLRTKVLRTARGWKQLEIEVSSDVLTIVDLSLIEEGQQQAKIEAMLLEDRMCPFDPEGASALMARIVAFLRNEKTFELIVSAHHGFCDGWSLRQWYNHLFDLYRAYRNGDGDRIEAIDQALAIHERSFRELVGRERATESTELDSFWQGYLPRSFHVPTHRTGSAFARHETMIERADRGMVAAAKARAKAVGVSLKAVLLDAFSSALVSQTPTQLPLIVAVVTNGRRDDLRNPLDVFGLCWTIVPAITRSELPLKPRLLALHDDLNATAANTRYSIEAMFRGRDPVAVATASFNFTNFHNSRWKNISGGQYIRKEESFHRFPFPLEFSARLDERSSSLVLRLDWSKGASDQGRARRLMDRFASGLAQ